ncbi:MAG: hypothetical protein M3347_12805 [Armatimonadota bacterium]|nr:hypothetical protein [Armatimonadota bacterium]
MKTKGLNVLVAALQCQIDWWGRASVPAVGPRRLQKVGLWPTAGTEAGPHHRLFLWRRILGLTALLVTSAGSGSAQNLVCEGVLGNSGEAGKTLVRFAPREASGLGVVVDRFGSLWDRAGVGTLNRYAPDGRLLAQYRIPGGAAGAGGQDKIATVGDTLILKLGDGLYSLPVDAPADNHVKNLNTKATRLSSAQRDGWLAAANDLEVFLFHPATGEKKPLGTLQEPVSTVEIGPEGAIYTASGGRVSKLGEATAGNAEGDGEGWPKKFPGDRLQWLDGWWWGHAYHSTIYRYDATLEPAPGVVLGGASGTFIGHLAQNTELSNGRGLALMRPGVFAVSGWSGILHLLQWQEEANQFQIVRRIGAVSFCRGIGLDGMGNVWWRSGAWTWNDRPDAPLEYGINTPEDGLISQTVMLPGETMLAVGRMNGKSAFFRGRLTAELKVEFIQPQLDRDIVAAASYIGEKNERFLIAVNAAGQGRLLSIGSDGSFRADKGPVALQAATPIKAWTSLAMKDDKTLLGSGDGHVIEMARDGDNWKETARWNGWGEGEKFGAKIWIAADAGRLWVADREKNRVLCFDPATKRLSASFGGEKGDDLAHLDAPESIAARGDRGVVFDSGNQRLVKLQWKK